MQVGTVFLHPLQRDEVQVLNLLNSSLSQVTLPHLVSTSQSIVADFKLINMQRVAAECICLLFWHREMYFVHRLKPILQPQNAMKL
jgi:hypothetical protein